MSHHESKSLLLSINDDIDRATSLYDYFSDYNFAFCPEASQYAHAKADYVVSSTSSRLRHSNEFDKNIIVMRSMHRELLKRKEHNCSEIARLDGRFDALFAQYAKAAGPEIKPKIAKLFVKYAAWCGHAPVAPLSLDVVYAAIADRTQALASKGYSVLHTWISPQDFHFYLSGGGHERAKLKTHTVFQAMLDAGTSPNATLAWDSDKILLFLWDSNQVFRSKGTAGFHDTMPRLDAMRKRATTPVSTIDFFTGFQTMRLVVDTVVVPLAVVPSYAYESPDLADWVDLSNAFLRQIAEACGDDSLDQAIADRNAIEAVVADAAACISSVPARRVAALLNAFDVRQFAV